MQNLSIIQKMLMILGLLGLFVLGVAYYVCGQMRDIDESYTQLMRGDDHASLMMARANRVFAYARGDIADLMLSNTDAGDVAASAAEAKTVELFQSLMDDAAHGSPAYTSDIREISMRAMKVMTQDCAKSIALGKQSLSGVAALASQQEYLDHCSAAFPPVSDALVKLVNVIGSATNQKQGALSALTSRTILITYGGIIGGLVLIGLLAFGAIRAWIIVPLRQQLATMARLADGDYGAVVAGAERRDEVGAIARAVSVFRENGQAKLRLEAETATQRAEAEAERARQEAQRSAVAQQGALVVKSLATGLEKLSAGDLLFRLGTPFATEYETLRADFNAAMEKMQETMKVIASTTQGVRSGSGEITQASDDLSRRTEQQAASLEETAAALDQITATVRRTAENAQEARATASSAKQEAEHSGSVVNDTVTAMSGIEASARQIGNIIGVIDEIAFQTNLLALNAGVEAARAGDAGRGFAVVATEVRALAQRSADAAKDIKALISASGKQVESGVRLVGETGTALGRIVAQVERLSSLVGEIAGSAQEQATGLAEVNAAVNQMDQVTQQNAAMVEQSTAASHNLAAEAETLAQLVAQFRIGGAASEAPPPVRQASPMRPAASLSRRPGASVLADA